jgi:hypothetical protein
LDNVTAPHDAEDASVTLQRAVQYPHFTADKEGPKTKVKWHNHFGNQFSSF